MQMTFAENCMYMYSVLFQFYSRDIFYDTNHMTSVLKYKLSVI